MSVEELTAGLNEAQLREGAEEYSRLMQMLAPIADGVNEGPAPVDNLAPIPDDATRPETRRKAFGMPQKLAALALAGAAGFATIAPNFLQSRPADYKEDGTEVALPTNYVQLDGVRLVSVDASLTAPGLPSADLATAKDCAPGEVKFYRTAGNEFGPAIAAGNIEETKAEIYTRLGQDPALLTDLYEVTGNASFSKEGRDEQIRKYMDDIGLREADCQKVIDIIEASEVTFDELSGLYITDYMTDKNGDNVPEIVKGLEKSAVNQRTLLIKIPKGPTIELKLGCGAQPGEEKEEEKPTPTTKAVPATAPPTTSRMTSTTHGATTTTGQTTSTTMGTTSTTMGTTSTTMGTTSTTMGTTSTTMGTTSTTQPNTTTTVPPKDAEPPVTGGPTSTVPPVTEAPQPTNVPTTEVTVPPSTETTDVRQRVGASTELSAEAKAEVEAARKAAETSVAAKAAAAHQRTARAAAASTRRAGESAAQRVTRQKQAQAVTPKVKAASEPAGKSSKANKAESAPKAKAPAAEATPAAAEAGESKSAKRKALTEKAASIVLPFLGFRRREEAMELELIRRN